jgi:protein TonB
MGRLSSETERNIISYAITATVYIPLLWWSLYSSHISISPSHIKAEEVSIELNQFCEPKEEIKEEPIVEPIEKPIEEPIEELKPKEIIEERVVEEEIAKVEPKKEPKPIVEHLPPKPTPKRKISPKRKHKKIAKNKKQKRDSSKRYSSSSKNTKIKNHKNSITKQKFLHRLRSKIDANKRYPRIAQKRGMQGSVKANFTITSSGKLSKLKVIGSRIFINSAKRAIKRSFPISTKGVKLPMSVSLTLKYKLKR